VLVAWKDTREARWAIADSLPFLKKATKVTVAAIATSEAVADTRASLTEVVDWLAHHGVTAESRLVQPIKADAPQLMDLADELKTTLIIAGAYGYQRQRQWIWGGITAELLAGDRCALLSH